MLCTFWPPTILGDLYRIPEKLPKSSADKMYRACETKDQTLKKIRTLLGHTPSTAATFRKKFRKNSGKTPETLWERFLEFPSRVRLGSPKPNSRHLRLPERFPEFSPPQYGWERLFFQNWFRRGPPRAGHGIPSSTEGISDLHFPEIKNYFSE